MTFFQQQNILRIEMQKRNIYFPFGPLIITRQQLSVCVVAVIFNYYFIHSLHNFNSKCVCVVIKKNPLSKLARENRVI